MLIINPGIKELVYLSSKMLHPCLFKKKRHHIGKYQSIAVRLHSLLQIVFSVHYLTFYRLCVSICISEVCGEAQGAAVGARLDGRSFE